MTHHSPVSHGPHSGGPARGLRRSPDAGNCTDLDVFFEE